MVIEGSFKDVSPKQTQLENQRKPTKVGSDWIPHGFFRKISEFGDVEFFGCFMNGELKGKCWKSLIGGKPLALIN